MVIHGNFTGGNIKVVKIEGNTVYLKNEQRGSMQDWFYWAFCVEGADGKTLTFQFIQKNRVGYWGAAVSKNLEDWSWSGQREGESFTYRFAKDESKVYFAHDLLYHPARFFEFAKEQGIALKMLCYSQKGREIPYFILGDGPTSMLLTCRHHACEATGSYVLEGLLKAYSEHPVKGVKLFCVPFVDYDGVLDGDQGKSRAPHDPNRDYGPEASIYPAVAAIREYVKENQCHYAFDFHSPWHLGEQNDLIYIVENSLSRIDRFKRFGKLLEENLTENSMRYKVENNYPPSFGWNQPGPNCSYTMMHQCPECVLSLSFESAYFGTEDNKVSEERLLELGKSFYFALQRYLEETNPNH